MNVTGLWADSFLELAKLRKSGYPSREETREARLKALKKGDMFKWGLISHYKPYRDMVNMLGNLSIDGKKAFRDTPEFQKVTEEIKSSKLDDYESICLFRNKIEDELGEERHSKLVEIVEFCLQEEENVGSSFQKMYRNYAERNRRLIRRLYNFFFQRDEIYRYMDIEEELDHHVSNILALNYFLE